MKYGLRSLMILVGRLVVSFFIGLIAAGAAMVSVAFVLEGIQSQPTQAVVPSLIMLGFAAVLFLVARFTWREAWREFNAIQNGPPSWNEPPPWGAPPPPPASQAAAPNPPKP